MVALVGRVQLDRRTPTSGSRPRPSWSSRAPDCGPAGSRSSASSSGSPCRSRSTSRCSCSGSTRPTRPSCSARRSGSGRASFGSCVVAVKRKGSGSLADLGLVRPRGVDVALGVGFGIASLIAVVIVAAVLQAIDSDLLPGGRLRLRPSRSSTAASSGSWSIYLIAVVGAPFFEELYFRGLVQGGLTARWGVAAGLVIQAVLFALVHLNPDNGLGNVGTFLIIGDRRHRARRDPPADPPAPAGDLHPRDLQRDHRHGRGRRRHRPVELVGAQRRGARREERRARSPRTRRSRRPCCSVRPMSSRPLSRRCWVWSSSSNGSSRSMAGSATRWSTTSTTSSSVGSSSIARRMRSTTSAGSDHRDEARSSGELLRKMSAKRGEITAWKP